jgi:hypothetical protein
MNFILKVLLCLGVESSMPYVLSVPVAEVERTVAVLFNLYKNIDKNNLH